MGEELRDSGSREEKATHGGVIYNTPNPEALAFQWALASRTLVLSFAWLK